MRSSWERMCDPRGRICLIDQIVLYVLVTFFTILLLLGLR